VIETEVLDKGVLTITFSKTTEGTPAKIKVKPK
jgi:hypothetical protein